LVTVRTTDQFVMFHAVRTVRQRVRICLRTTLRHGVRTVSRPSQYRVLTVGEVRT
jgi:hypothetical protein